MKLCDKISQVVGGAQVNTIAYGGRISLQFSELIDDCVDVDINELPFRFEVIRLKNDDYNVIAHDSSGLFRSETFEISYDSEGIYFTFALSKNDYFGLK